MKRHSLRISIRAVVVELLGLFVLVWLILPTGPAHENRVVTPILQVPPLESASLAMTPVGPTDPIRRHAYVARQLDYHALFFWKLLSKHFKQVLIPDRRLAPDPSAANHGRDD